MVGILADDDDFDFVERCMARPELVRQHDMGRKYWAFWDSLPRIHVFLWWKPFLASSRLTV
jgi:hypothetical protein